MTPLGDVRVIDFSQGAAGPYCGQLLADYGADVVKVEPPRGDWGRTLGNIHQASGMSSTHVALNRNKRSICLDLSQQRAVELADSLCAGADIVLESFRPGVMARLGLGPDRLRSRQPALVYCSITGFGRTGPLSDIPASDSMMQAFGGLMSVIGEPDGPPLRVGTVVSDMLAATNAFAGILLSLLRRSTTGSGGHVEVSLLDSIVAFQTTGLTDYLITGQLPPKPGNRHPLIGASAITPTADGYLAVGVLDHYWPTFCRALGLTAVGTDARFTTASARLVHQKELWETLGPVFAAGTTEHWIVALGDLGIVCGPVNDCAALLEHSQVKNNGIVGSVELGGERDVPMIAPPIRINDVEPSYAAPPQLGQHSVQIAHEQGLSDAQVDDLLRSGAMIGEHCRET